MKKYRLKQGYPSLPAELKVGNIVEFNGVDSIRLEVREKYEFTEYNWEFNGLELKCTQYWELIEEGKPLFVTEDGVNAVNGMRIHSVRKSNFDRDSYIVDEDFVKEQTSKHPYVYFFHESNADEYILRNKRVFSYNDLRSWDINGGTQEEALKIAKERSKEL